MTDHDMDERTRELLAEAYPPLQMQFDAGFADRVLARAGRAPASGEVSAALSRQSRRVLPLLLAASLALVAWNVSAMRGASSSLVAAVLGLSDSTRTPTTELLTLQGAEEFQ